MAGEWLFIRMARKLIRSGFPCADKRARRQLLGLDLSKQSLAIDCGAHVGEVTALLSRNGAQVFAFEPNPDAFRALENRFKNHKNVHCIRSAVLDRDGTLPLYLHEFSRHDPVKWATGSSLLESKPNVRKDLFEMVEVVDLSVFIRSLGRKVDVLKLDVEGVEYRILHKLIDEGSIDLVEHVFVETHHKKIPQLREEFERLKVRLLAKGLDKINLDWI